MTLYHALKKLDEVTTDDECRLNFGAQLELEKLMRKINLGTKASAVTVVERGAAVPKGLKRVSVTTTKPRKGKILFTYSNMGTRSADSDDYINYTAGHPDSEMCLCEVGLIHLFGKVPEKLYLAVTNQKRGEQ